MIPKRADKKLNGNEGSGEARQEVETDGLVGHPIFSSEIPYNRISIPFIVEWTPA
jgi:hypothetical protein